MRLNLAGNLPEGSRARMLETLAVVVTVDRNVNSIDVVANADLGGTLIAKWLLSYSGPDKTVAESGVEGSLGATEIVLAIDTTISMNETLDGLSTGGPNTR